MPASERRFWKCPNGHVMGEVAREAANGRHVRVLLLYEASVEIAPEDMPTLRGRLSGNMDDVRCTCCGATRSWEIGQDSLDVLLERTLKNSKVVWRQ
jgi:hypothetical protein